MKNTEMLNQIKTLLNIEVKLEEMKLENGTIITADSFEKDKEIFIVTDDEKVALPVGEYELEDGRILVIETEGIISDLKEKIEEEVEEEVVEETADLQVEDYEEKEIIKEEKEEVKEDLGYATKEELAAVIDMIKEIKDMIGDKEDMSDVNGSLKSRTVKEEFSEEVQTELSQPATKPLKHNPESGSKKKVEMRQSNFGLTALDRVLNRLNKQ
tara:strand:- start:306 stop:944 length:639 start_codon:yes stop_codon:yes gene_type:complete